MSETPRTDAVDVYPKDTPCADMVHAAFARQLERELAEARAEIAGAMQSISDLSHIAAAYKRDADEARALCRDIYEYALEVRTPDCAIVDPPAWLAKLRDRLAMDEANDSNERRR